MALQVRQQLFQKSVISPINGNALSAPHVGYLDKDKSQLEVQGTITQQASVNYFRFSFRNGEKIRLSTNMNRGVRVQLYDSSGTRLLADSSGSNVVKKEAYAKLVGTGLELKRGDYVVKVLHGTGVSKSRPLNYDFILSSGTTFVNRYKTLAYADTMKNYLATGGTLGYNPAATAATALTNSVTSTYSQLYDGTGATIFNGANLTVKGSLLV